jgi:hypothetical protein
LQEHLERGAARIRPIDRKLAGAGMHLESQGRARAKIVGKLFRRTR